MLISKCARNRTPEGGCARPESVPDNPDLIDINRKRKLSSEEFFRVFLLLLYTILIISGLHAKKNGHKQHVVVSLQS